MNPGDFIEWTYKSNGEVVVPNEELWSSMMRQRVPIGCTNNLLISIYDDCDARKCITWLNDKRLVHARVNDSNCAALGEMWRAVVPRAR